MPIDGGMPEQLPLPRGGWCSYSPDKKQLVYNRVFREFRTWKRYRGGQADDMWIYDFENKTTTNITNNPACDIMPMWHGAKIYFLSDRDANKRMNLFAYDLKTKATRQITHYKEFDVKFPSLGDTAIVFENGGFLYRFEMATDGGRRSTVYCTRTWWGAAADCEVGSEVTALRHVARRQAGPVRRPRRDLHGARPARQYPQSDADLGRPRARTRSGRPTAGGSPTSPTPAARTRSTSCPRTAAGPPRN